MSIFIGDNSSNIVMGLEPNSSYTLSVKITPNILSYQRIWITLSNTLANNNFETGPFIEIGDGAYENPNLYSYNNYNTITNTGYINSLTPNSDNTIASKEFFLPFVPCVMRDNNNTLLTKKFYPDRMPVYLSLWGYNGDSILISSVEITITFPPTVSPIYLGKAKVDNEGNLVFGYAVATTATWPVTDNYLVPAAYVKGYINKVKSHYDAILEERTSELVDTRTRVNALEAQLNRLYVVLFNLNRNEPIITTPHSGNVVADYDLATIDNSDITASIDSPTVSQGFK